MSRLAEFFRDADTSVGVFHPKHCLVAVFPDIEEANRAVSALIGAGYAAEDVTSASGAEVLAYAEEHQSKSGLWGLFMTGVSRTIGTEAEYADQDMDAARNGAAFVAVHCPTEQLKTEAWSVLATRNPLAARYYTSAGIEHLVGEI